MLFGPETKTLEAMTKSGGSSPGEASYIQGVQGADYSGLVANVAWNAIEKPYFDELMKLSSSKTELFPLPPFSSIMNGNEETIEWCFSLELILLKTANSKFVFVELGGGFGRWTFRAGQTCCVVQIIEF
jgi:hypothetical protein